MESLLLDHVREQGLHDADAFMELLHLVAGAAPVLFLEEIPEATQAPVEPVDLAPDHGEAFGARLVVLHGESFPDALDVLPFHALSPCLKASNARRAWRRSQALTCCMSIATGHGSSVTAPGCDLRAWSGRSTGTIGPKVVRPDHRARGPVTPARSRCSCRWRRTPHTI